MLKYRVNYRYHNIHTREMGEGKEMKIDLFMQS